MNQEELKEFLGSLKNTDIEELTVQTGETKIFFRKGEVAVMPAPAAQAAASQKAAKEAENKVVPIKSPMVGTFYHSETADHPPFVIEGNHIEPGMKVGFIETMKIMKNVASNVKGRIVKVSVTNGQSVEYGQELFLVDTGDIKGE